MRRSRPRGGHPLLQRVPHEPGADLGARGRAAVRIAGVPRVGENLTCALPAFDQPPDGVDVRWLRRTTGADGAYRLVKIGEGISYTAVAADAGKLVDCEAPASNAGGRTLVPLASGSAVQIAP